MGDATPSITIVETFTHDIGIESCETSRADQRWMAGTDADSRSAILPVKTDDDVHAEPWETHPLADEAVCCLCGVVRLYLRAQTEAVDGAVPLLPGEAATRRH
jgi:hypothetical protein